MSDVRALLRAERAARDPPNTKRTHATASQIPSKKRKGGQEDRAEDEGRKRPKEDDSYQQEAAEDSANTVDQIHENPITSTALVSDEPIKVVPTDAVVDVDEDEWAAFERDVATPPPSPPRQTAINALQSNSAISAAPVTKADLEAEKKKENNQAKRVQREEDLAAEKEEAARNLEEEFEEMDALEQRIKKLKEQRERLRAGTSDPKPGSDDIEVDSDTPSADDKVIHPEADDEEFDDEDEDEDEDEDDAWVFGKRR
jgi:hypothetical protein